MSKDVGPQKKPSMPSGDIHEAAGSEKISSLSSVDWSKSVNTSGNQGAQAENFGSVLRSVNSGSVFSSSLPVVLHEKGKLSSSLGESVDCEGAHIERETGELTFGSLYDEGATSTIGDLLPDDEEELLAGISDGLECLNLYSATEENEDFDLFSSGGGLEMDGDVQDAFGMYANSSRNLNGGFLGNSGSLNGPSNVPGSVIGEHPYGEHPSRTLFVRNINSNVEDSELRALFEHFGDIRTLYTTCKQRGFVMISYYDIRSARSAMRALQNKPLRRRKLDIHFSIPKDNPSDKDVNQGTLVVFNLDVSVSNDDLCQIFGHYGEIKEIRETPHKRHHKFIEFYDVRAAEAALRALNRSDIAGKRIKLEPSRPGGARRSLMQQLSQDLEQEEVRSFRQQASSPMASSPPGQFSPWGVQFGSPAESSPSWTSHNSVGNYPGINKPFPGFSVTLPPPNSMRVGTIGSHLGRTSSGDANLPSIPTTSLGMPMHRAHSLPDHANGMAPFVNTQSPIPVRGTSHDAVEGLRISRVGSDVSLFENAPGGIGIPDGGSANRLNSGSGSTSLSGPQFLWGNSNPYQQTSSSVVWSTPPTGQDFNPPGHTLQARPSGHTLQARPFAYAGPHGSFAGGGFSSHRFHAGSAPSGDPSILERHPGYFMESPDTSFFGPSSLRPPLGAQGASMLNMSSAHQISGSLGTNGGFETGSLPYRRSYMFPTGSMNMSGTSEGFADRARIRRTESSASQAESKKQYQLDIERILRGEDNRTTLMIKNIPNKYTSKMLLAALDENHRGTYDFMYLPIDFKNKCNVGYAFINMTSPSHIIPLYQAFNGKKWEKFNSEKVASLAYARIQGKAALVAHFQNSSLMNEDKRCRPILFHSEGLEIGEQEQIPLTIDIRDRISRERNGFREFMEANTQSSINNA